jgi:predicted RNA-binding protein
LPDGRKYWIFGVSLENWKVTLQRNLWGVPQRYQSITKKVKLGDIILIFISKVHPFGFHGAFEVVSDWTISNEKTWADELAQDRVLYPYRIQLRPVQTGFAEYERLVPNLGFVERKEKGRNSVYLRGNPAHFGRPVAEADFQRILDELRKNPPITIGSEERERVRRQPARISSSNRTIEQPDHDTLRGMIQEIGLMEKMVSETEYRMDGRRLDVVWKKVSEGVPSHAFEVQIGGNFFEALSKLKHAYDIWNSKPILVTTEKYEGEARSLFKGSFHEIGAVAMVVSWKKISRLHKLLKEAESTRRDVGL